MNARLRFLPILAFAVGGTLLVACDSDDPSEADPVRFEGVYAVEGRFDGTAARDGAEARKTDSGTCCFRLELDMGNDAEGDVRGGGTMTYLTEDGTESETFDADVEGMTAGDAVVLTLTFQDVFTLTFEGTVAEDGSTITGAFSGVILEGQTFTLVRES